MEPSEFEDQSTGEQRGKETQNGSLSSAVLMDDRQKMVYSS